MVRENPKNREKAKETKRPKKAKTAEIALLWCVSPKKKSKELDTVSTSLDFSGDTNETMRRTKALCAPLCHALMASDTGPRFSGLEMQALQQEGLSHAHFV